jgi:hypothetical protein
VSTSASIDRIDLDSGSWPQAELVWVGPGHWIVCDPRAGAGDPRCVLAVVERMSAGGYELRARGRSRVIEFPSLPAARDTIGAILVGGVRQTVRS